MKRFLQLVILIVLFGLGVATFNSCSGPTPDSSSASPYGPPTP